MHIFSLHPEPCVSRSQYLCRC